ncbi:MAG TPA: class I tRNA ligase family protein, partial [Candidatus Competibacteraceae bacterium]|nr:class I tRNA ligase family protein [Candidatus Competibacteraceae bacterium]
LQTAVQEFNVAVQGYRFDQAAQTLYEFVWNEYCDWYLELSKPVLTQAENSEAARRGTRRTLVRVLETLLRLAHPLMPFITEEIWQRVAPLAGVQGETIMLQPFPLPDPSQLDSVAVAEIGWLQQFLLGVRRIRAEMDIAPGRLLPVLLQQGSSEDRQRLERNRTALLSLGRLDSITWLEDIVTAPEAAIALVGQMKLLIPLAGLIDKTAEIARLNRELDKLRNDLERGEAKLNNVDFTGRAPPQVVEKERARVAEIKAAVTRLDEQLQRMQRL